MQCAYLQCLTNVHSKAKALSSKQAGESNKAIAFQPCISMVCKTYRSASRDAPDRYTCICKFSGKKKYISKKPQLPLFIFWRVKHLQLSGQGTTVLTQQQNRTQQKAHASFKGTRTQSCNACRITGLHARNLLPAVTKEIHLLQTPPMVPLLTTAL